MQQWAEMHLSRSAGAATIQNNGELSMKLKKTVWILGVGCLLAGCASITQPRALVLGQTIQNDSLGFYGFSIKIPDGFSLYQPAAEDAVDYTELQRMAIRIYELNKAYHPAGNEYFYESFLLFSDKACFLLVMLKTEDRRDLYESPFGDTPFEQRDLLPLYNPATHGLVSIGENRREALYTTGSAYEKQGWYYPSSRRNSQLFNYEACKALIGNRAQCIVMGFALPEDQAALAAPMQQLMDGMKF